MKKIAYTIYKNWDNILLFFMAILAVFCSLDSRPSTIDSQIRHNVKRMTCANAGGCYWSLIRKDRTLAVFYGYNADVDNFKLCKAAEAIDPSALCTPIR